jgi:hypothetical protein
MEKNKIVAGYFNSYTKSPISHGVFVIMTAKKVCPNFSSDKTEPNL